MSNIDLLRKLAEVLAIPPGVLGLATGSGPPRGRPTAMMISAVSGTAGVGKPRWRCIGPTESPTSSPDGHLYVNLRGFDPSSQVMDPADAVRGFLDALGVASQRIPVELDAQAALYRSRLAGSHWRMSSATPAPAAASLAGIPPTGIRPLLVELTRAHLISEPIPGRYRFHRRPAI